MRQMRINENSLVLSQWLPKDVLAFAYGVRVGGLISPH